MALNSQKRTLKDSLDAAASVARELFQIPVGVDGTRGAEQLVCYSPNAASVVVRHSDWREARARWAWASSRLEVAGALVEPNGLVALTSAAAVFRLAWCLRGQSVHCVLKPQSLAALAWLRPVPLAGSALPWCYRGFVRTEGEPLSLALATPAEIALAQRALNLNAWPPRGILPGAADDLAHWLQDWGLAAVPARLAIDSRAGADANAMFPTPTSQAWDLLPTDKPLRGRRVVVAGNLVAAPFAGVLLAEAGATVVHIHLKQRQPLRFRGFVITDSEVVDLASPGKRWQQLIERADAFVENFRPRVLPNLQLYPEVATHVSLPAFSASSERANWRALGFQLEALVGCGLRPLTQPMVLSGDAPLISDYCVALTAAAAVILERGRMELPQDWVLSAHAGIGRDGFSSPE